jgi:hypothetical protein
VLPKLLKYLQEFIKKCRIMYKDDKGQSFGGYKHDEALNVKISKNTGYGSDIYIYYLSRK